MARIRAIKPEFWSSPGIEDVSPWARLLYIAMWNWADDSGAGVANPRELLGFAFPLDMEQTSELVSEYLKEIEANFGVVFYEVKGRQYFFIPSWESHQKFDRRSKGKYPLPPGYENTRGIPTNTRRDSVAGTGEVGTEEKGTEELFSKTRNSRIPSNFSVCPEDAQLLQKEFPNLNLTSEAQKFKDYWQASASPTAIKSDWDAAFRTWIRNASEKAPSFRTGYNVPPAPSIPKASELHLYDCPLHEGYRQPCDRCARDLAEGIENTSNEVTHV